MAKKAKTTKSSQVNEVSKADRLYHVLMLALVGVLMFVGVMSLVDADPIVRYTLASVVVFFIVKDLFKA